MFYRGILPTMSACLEASHSSKTNYRFQNMTLTQFDTEQNSICQVNYSAIIRTTLPTLKSG